MVGPLRTVLLDLDDTLYPKDSGVWEAIGDRIEAFMVEQVGIPRGDAPRLRQDYFEQFGTSLNGLVARHAIDPDHYLAYVHDVRLEDYLRPDPRLEAMLRRLARPPAIFTNADSAHARRVLGVLGVAELVGPVIDIVALGWVNKPRPEAYSRALEIVGEDDPTAVVVVDDQPRNLAPARALGMTTVLVGTHPTDTADHVIPGAGELLQALPALALRPS